MLLVCHFLVTHCRVDWEIAPVAAPDEVPSIDLFANDLDGEADWDLVALTKCPL